jgi:hypothetical protein
MPGLRAEQSDEQNGYEKCRKISKDGKEVFVHNLLHYKNIKSA